jgi:hypothetical protein
MFRHQAWAANSVQGSKSVQKRQREEQASEAVDKKARLLRQEMRRRGHAVVLRCRRESRGGCLVYLS